MRKTYFLAPKWGLNYIHRIDLYMGKYGSAMRYMERPVQKLVLLALACE